MSEPRKKRAVEHRSVLLKEAVDLLNVRVGGFYLDATLGDGGHSRLVLERGGHVLGLDVDSEAVLRARAYIGRHPHFKAVRGNFLRLDEITAKEGYSHCDGIVFDLGLSTFQLKGSGRGFSYLSHESLDMRADTRLVLSAKDIVNRFPKEKLYEIFTKFGEERLSARLVDLIEKQRLVGPITRSDDLYALVGLLVDSEESRRKVAARVFQALRIAVNNELENLREALPRALGVLRPKGRLVIITYHSLEDRLVKRFFLSEESKGKGLILTRRPLAPSRTEVGVNSSSRSAKLRALEKIYD